jgi:hypothetical protein
MAKSNHGRSMVYLKEIKHGHHIKPLSLKDSSVELF